jgi:thioredoxin-related protein
MCPDRCSNPNVSSIVIGNQPLAKQYGVDSMPVTLLIDRSGKIAESRSGMVDKSVFETDIRRLLRENIEKH